MYSGFQTLDAYDLGEKLTAINEAEVERIAEEYIRQQATLEFVDDMVCKISFRIPLLYYGKLY